jgi:hypothetical protein
VEVIDFRIGHGVEVRGTNGGLGRGRAIARALGSSEARQVQAWIADETPEQLNLPSALWASRAVRELIERRSASVRPVHGAALPKSLGYDAGEASLIYWGDETGISNQDQIGRTYTPRGETPVVGRIAKKVSKSMISASLPAA